LAGERSREKGTVKPVVIRYRQRLGDIVRMLPLARHFAQQGREVIVDCLPQYHGLFAAVSYATPVFFYYSPPSHELIDLEIWPNRYGEFRASGLTWAQFVYRDFPGVDPTAIVFDVPQDVSAYKLPPDYCLVSPFGYSQRRRYIWQSVLWFADRKYGRDRTLILADKASVASSIADGWPASRFLCALTPAHLPALIAGAAKFLTINSAPGIIAGAVRKSYHLLPECDPQDDWIVPATRIVTLPNK
jgi:hypothetical protein